MLDGVYVVLQAWFDAVAFVGYGVYLWVRPNHFMEPGDLLVKLARGYPRIIRYRLYAAFERRHERPDPRFGRAAAIICFGLGVLVGLKTNMVLYIVPIAALILIPLLAYAYTHVQFAPTTRVATLERRPPASVVGGFWFVAFFMLSLIPLFLLKVTSARTDAILTVAASLVAVICAWFVAKTPSVISSVDPVVERFADERLRRFRSSALLGCTGILTFFFVIYNQSAMLLPFGIGLIALWGQIAASIMMWLQLRPVSHIEVTHWFEGPQPQ
jgi:hypothetical protein